MFRYKDRMLKQQRRTKKKNCNKESSSPHNINIKDMFRFRLKAIQQDLIKKGIKVHTNDLRQLTTTSYHLLSEDEKIQKVGNTTKGNLILALNNNIFDDDLFPNNSNAIAKTHDMTRWRDKKTHSIEINKRRNFKLESQQFFD